MRQQRQPIKPVMGLCICIREPADHTLTGTGPIQLFVEKQHLKWLAYVIQMDNSSLKQTLFMEGRKDMWISHLEYYRILRIQMDGWTEKVFW